MRIPFLDIKASYDELREELEVASTVSGELLTTTHEYEDRRVELHFLRCEILGSPAPQLGQEVRWVSKNELRLLRFPAADEELIRLLSQTT